MKIYVGNLDYQLTEDDLKTAFQAYGKVESVRIFTDSDTGRSKGFGFLEMPVKDEALKAIEALNETKLGGRTIVANESCPKPKHNDHPEEFDDGLNGTGDCRQGGSSIKETQKNAEPVPPLSEFFSSFTDTRIQGALADALDSPSVTAVHERIERLNKKEQNIPWLKIIKVGSMAIGIPSMVGVLGFTVFNYLYPQKVKDFLARSKLFRPRPTIVSSQHSSISEVDMELSIRFAEGEKLIAQGKNLEAQALFTRLQQSKKIGHIDRSKVWNRLGKLYAASNHSEEALSAFRKSFQVDPDCYESYVDHAVLLRNRGDWSAALDSVKAALEKNPDDIIAQAIEQELAERLALEKDKEKKRHLDQLVKEFSDVSRDKHKSLPPSSSGMRTIIFLDFISRGRIPDRLGESDYIKYTLMQTLQQNKSVKVGERVLIDRLLMKLKLGPSEIVDPKVLAKLGRILDTRCIAVGTIHRFEKESEIVLKLIDTETSKTIAVLTEKITIPDSLKQVSEHLAAKIIDTLDQQLGTGAM